MFGFLIFIHELGHFLAAKSVGVGIYEFSIGMGPALLKHIGKDGIKYSLRILPFGGYVSMYGEDEDECPDKTKSLSTKSVWARFFVISAGAAMNIILGVLLSLLLIIFGSQLYSNKIQSFNFVDEVGNPISITEYKGLRLGDEILKVGNRSIFVRHDLVYEAMSLGEENVDITVLRDGKKVTVKDFTFPTTTEKGIVFGVAAFFMPEKLEKTPLEVVKQTFFQSVAIVRMIWTSLIDTVSGKYGVEAVSGPVGVVSEVKETVKYGFSSFITMFMIITLNLGVVNLLPLPALDGGRLLFLFIEMIRGKPINPKYEGIVHFIGLALLMTLMIFITFNDIAKLFK